MASKGREMLPRSRLAIFSHMLVLMYKLGGCDNSYIRLISITRFLKLIFINVLHLRFESARSSD